MTADSFNPLTETPPSSQPASEPLTVEHHASQDREKEWYFVVMEPRSKGIYRRGYSCYISKNLDIVDAEFEALRQAEESFAPVHALPDSESPGLTDDERVLLEKYRALTPDCGYHMITAVKGVLVTYPEFNRLQAAASTPDSDTRWYCPDCDEHHATAELTATPESHQPACPDCGHEVEMEWTDKDFVVPDSDTRPPSETPGKPPVSGDTTEEQPEMIEESMRHYVSNLGELRRGIVGVALPLGSVDAIERLSRDLIAFGFGMGESQARICDQLEWYEKAETARKNLLRNVASLSSRTGRCSTPMNPPSRLTRLSNPDTPK